MLALTTAAILALSEVGANGPDGDLVSLAARGNQASVDLIDNYHAKVAWTVTVAGKSNTIRGEFWKTRTLTRQREIQNNRVVDVLNEAGKISVMVSEAAPDGAAAKASEVIKGEPNRRSVETDAWELSLFTLPVGLQKKPPYSIYTLHDAVAKGGTVGSWDVVNGKRLIKLEIPLEDERRFYVAYVDPERNYLTTSCKHVIRDETNREVWSNEYEVEEFREVQDALFVPVRTRATMRFQDGTLITGLATLENISINDPASSTPKMPNLVRGSRIMDEVAGVIHVAGRDGKPEGRAVRMGQPYSPPVGAAPEAAEQHRGYDSLLGWGFLAVAATSAGVLFYRKIRGRS